MSLKLILGCMYSGKTTEILRIVNSLKHIDEIPLIIKPAIDNRYSIDKISTHDNIEYDCKTVNNLSELKNIENNYIIIEEAQFFRDLYLFIIHQVDINHKNVIVVGLDGDSNRENFGNIHTLLPLCDDIIKLKAYCSICKNGTSGIFSKRINKKNKDTVFVGSDDDYIAVCRKCYLSKITEKI